MLLQQQNENKAHSMSHTLEILHMSSGEKRISADNSKRYTNMIKNDRKRALQIVNNQIKFQSATD